MEFGRWELEIKESSIGIPENKQLSCLYPASISQLKCNPNEYFTDIHYSSYEFYDKKQMKTCTVILGRHINFDIA